MIRTSQISHTANLVYHSYTICRHFYSINPFTVIQIKLSRFSNLCKLGFRVISLSAPQYNAASSQLQYFKSTLDCSIFSLPCSFKELTLAPSQRESDVRLHIKQLGTSWPVSNISLPLPHWNVMSGMTPSLRLYSYVFHVHNNTHLDSTYHQTKAWLLRSDCGLALLGWGKDLTGDQPLEPLKYLETK